MPLFNPAALDFVAQPTHLVYLEAGVYKARETATGNVIAAAGDANDAAVPINYCFTNGPSTGTAVALAGGTLFQRTDIVLKRDGDSLVGLGHRNVTRLRLTDSFDPTTAMIVVGRDGNLTRCRLERLHLFGNWTPLAAAGHVAGHGLVVYGGANVVRDVTIEGMIGDGFHWDSQDGTSGVFEMWAENLNVVNCGNDGIYCSPLAFNGEFLRCTVQGAAQRFSSVSMTSGSNVVTNNVSGSAPFVADDTGKTMRIAGASSVGTYLWGTFTFVSASSGTLSVNASATATAQEGYLFRASRYGIYNLGTQNKFLFCHPYHTQDNAFYADGSGGGLQALETVVIGGEYESVAGHGIRLLSVTRPKIHDTLAYGNGASGKLDASISSCADVDFQDNTWRSDNVAQNLTVFGTSRGLVRGNTCRNGTTQGIRVQTGGGILVQGNSAKSITLDGCTNTDVADNYLPSGITEANTSGTPSGNRIKRNRLTGGEGGTPAVTPYASSTTTEVEDNFGDAARGVVSTPSVTASPMTYTAGARPETLFVDGGTVSAIAKGGTTVFTSTGKAIPLRPNESVVLTYSSAPTLTKQVL